MPITFENLAKYRGTNRVLVETGTSRGQGVLNALAAGFERVRSVEPFAEAFEDAYRQFHLNPRVTLFFGWSEEMLGEMLADLHEPVTFWLDGHYCGTAMGAKSCPLLEELAIIGRHPVKTHTILIDDMRCWRRDDPTIGFGREEIEAAILAINPAYVITYEDGVDPVVANDILVARVSE